MSFGAVFQIYLVRFPHAFLFDAIGMNLDALRNHVGELSDEVWNKMNLNIVSKSPQNAGFPIEPVGTVPNGGNYREFQHTRKNPKNPRERARRYRFVIPTCESLDAFVYLQAHDFNE